MESQLAALERVVTQNTLQPLNPSACNEKQRQPSHTHTLSIASGKGGVGKTTFIVNLAATLAAMKTTRSPRVLLLDADWGMANAHIYLNVQPRATIAAVLNGQRALHEIIYPTRFGFDLICGGSAMKQLFSLNIQQRNFLEQELMALTEQVGYDFLLIDCAAGAAAPVLELLHAADSQIIVTTPQTAAMTDAYALIKMLMTAELTKSPAAADSATAAMASVSAQSVYVVMNQVQTLAAGTSAAKRLSAVSAKFLSNPLQLLGIIHHHPMLQTEVWDDALVTLRDSTSYTAIGFRKIAWALLNQLDPTIKPHSAASPPRQRSDLRGFFKRVFNRSAQLSHKI